MARELYCWRCRIEMPMLDEDEWERIGPDLSASSDPGRREAALDLYEKMTGVRETNINAIWHHRISDYGPPCDECGKALRTPRAHFCAACGKPRDVQAHSASQAASDLPSSQDTAPRRGWFGKFKFFGRTAIE